LNILVIEYFEKLFRLQPKQLNYCHLGGGMAIRPRRKKGSCGKAGITEDGCHGIRGMFAAGIPAKISVCFK